MGTRNKLKDLHKFVRRVVSDQPEDSFNISFRYDVADDSIHGFSMTKNISFRHNVADGSIHGFSMAKAPVVRDESGQVLGQLRGSKKQ
jgi:hypothetical protein